MEDNQQRYEGQEDLGSTASEFGDTSVKEGCSSPTAEGKVKL